VTVLTVDLAASLPAEAILHAVSIAAVLRTRIARRYRNVLRGRTPLAIDPSKRAIVFAPHPDDETLGCGGTISMKTQVGAPVSIVVLTDGRRSHLGLIDEDRLRAIRAAEAHTAAERLGVPRHELLMLGYADQDLEECRDAAVADVVRILDEKHPDEVFVPYRAEVPSDHRAAFSIVTEAVRETGRELALFEYPVWAWFQWPFVPLAVGGRRGRLAPFVRTLRSNYRILRDFDVVNELGDAIERKRRALDAHESQVTRLVADSRWVTLGDVANGSFLDSCLQPFEVFRSSRVGRASKTAG
jgi:LmbE family N-acetylglucosaminyl deacetylase